MDRAALIKLGCNPFLTGCLADYICHRLNFKIHQLMNYLS